MTNAYTAREAAARLGISLATLYSYVSRGVLQSVPDPDGSREKRYPAHLVDELAARRPRRDSGETGDGTKAPVFEWRERRPVLAGHDAISLATSRSVGEVAALMWSGDVKRSGPLFASVNALPASLDRLLELTDTLAPIERMQVLLPVAAEADPGSWDLRTIPAARSGATILHLLTAVACESADVPAEGIAGTLRSAWCPRIRRSEDVLRAAIILAADAGEDAAAQAVETVAGAGSHPYAAVSAGLGALQGTRLGARTRRIEALLHEIDRGSEAKPVLRARLERGESVPGFGRLPGHLADPRAATILDLLERSGAPARDINRVIGLVEAIREMLGEPPSLEFALVATGSVLRLPRDAALTLMAIGRSIGWIARCIGRYERARAR